MLNPSSLPRTSVLSNGLRVVTLTSSADYAYCDLLVDGGDFTDPADKMGCAHFAEHMWAYSHPDIKDKQFVTFLQDRALGGNLQTLPGKMRIFAEGLPEMMDDWRNWAATAMHALDYDDAMVDGERPAIVNEMENKIANQDFREEFLAINSALFGRDHRYAQPLGGLPEHLARLSAAELKANSRRDFVGSRLTALCVGPESHEQMVDTFEGLLGGLPKGKPLSVDKPATLSEVYREERPDYAGVHTRLDLLFDQRALPDQGSPRYGLAMNFLARALNDVIRSDRKLAYGASCSLYEGGFLPQDFMQVCIRATPDNTEAVQQAIYDTIRLCATDTEFAERFLRNILLGQKKHLGLWGAHPLIHQLNLLSSIKSDQGFRPLDATLRAAETMTPRMLSETLHAMIACTPITVSLTGDIEGRFVPGREEIQRNIAAAWGHTPDPAVRAAPSLRP